MQINFDEMLERDKRKNESNLPGYLQTESATLVRYTGESKTGLPHGAVGFIAGSGFGSSNNTKFEWRSARKEVSLLDLEPMKVTEFTDEEREMNYPKRFEYVKIIANKNMKVIDEGYLVYFTPDKLCISDRETTGEFVNDRLFDAKVHHFKGYEPKRLLVWRDEYEEC